MVIVASLLCGCYDFAKHDETTSTRGFLERRLGYLGIDSGGVSGRVWDGRQKIANVVLCSLSRLLAGWKSVLGDLGMVESYFRGMPHARESTW